MASKGLNKVMLIGNLGKDPEVRYMPSGNAVANITIATSESWTDKSSGEKKEKTEWHRVVFFGKLAEIVEKYLHKGSKIYVEGKLKTRKWTNKEGQDVYTTEVVVQVGGQMQMLDGKQSGGGQQKAESQDSAYNKQPAQHSPSQSAQNMQTPAKQGELVDDGFDDDIPF